jgi:hypothetical protein
MITIPMKPIKMENTRRLLGARRTQRAVTSAVTTGSPPFIIPATPLVTVCSARGNNQKGSAIQTNPSAAIRGQCLRGIATRDPRIHVNAAAPAKERPNGTTEGSKWSIATAIRRNDDPHVNASRDDSPHSAGPKSLVARIDRTEESFSHIPEWYPRFSFAIRTIVGAR